MSLHFVKFQCSLSRLVDNLSRQNIDAPSKINSTLTSWCDSYDKQLAFSIVHEIHNLLSLGNINEIGSIKSCAPHPCIKANKIHLRHNIFVQNMNTRFLKIHYTEALQSNFTKKPVPG